MIFIHPGLPGNCPRDPVMISRQHHNLSNAEGFQFASDLHGIRTQSISDRN
jgi:hypothetical protein